MINLECYNGNIHGNRFKIFLKRILIQYYIDMKMKFVFEAYLIKVKLLIRTELILF